MLKDTLVVWGGEFGRTPFNELSDGRDHNHWGFTMWMAGGGAKGGQYVGATDEIGMHAQETPWHVNDIHASMLWALGLDHLKTTYMHNGRAEGSYEDFLTGFVTKDGQVWGRPVGVTVAPDGALLVSDDSGNRIWRIAASSAAPRR